MTVLSLISALAASLGLAGVLPHISQMVRTRSAGGQSSLGWSTGLGVNVLMAYVNAALGAGVLVLGNVAGGLLCALALACVMRFRAAEQAPAPGDPAPRPAPAAAAPQALVDLPTGELIAVRDAALAEAARRERPGPQIGRPALA